MKYGLAAALAFLIAASGWVSAQQPLPAAPAELSVVGDEILRAEDLPIARTSGFSGSGEYLLWWFKSGRIPPMVTEGGDGRVGSPGTRVLVDNLDFDDDYRQGGRLTVGYSLEADPFIGIEASCFFLPNRQNDVRFSSSGDPVLAQPFINVDTGQPDATFVAFPGQASGSVTIGTRTGLWGAETNLKASPISTDTFHLTALGGFRFLRLEDELTNAEQFVFLGKKINPHDEFRTVNNFYGGQVGLETGVQLGLLTLDFRGKIALGQMHQVAHVSGATNVLNPDGSTAILNGGLYALPTNFGRHQWDRLAFIPEVDFNVGVQLTTYLKLYAGYSFLWVSSVARAGEQIDPVINITQLPIKSPGPLVGPPRPAFNFVGNDFWAQGLNFGLELRY